MDELIKKQDAIDVLRTCYDTETINMDNGDEYINYGDAVGGIEQLPSAQPETCEGCRHLGKWEDEVGYGYPSPCTCCKRRVEDNYER